MYISIILIYVEENRFYMNLCVSAIFLFLMRLWVIWIKGEEILFDVVASESEKEIDSLKNYVTVGICSIVISKVNFGKIKLYYKESKVTH